MKYFDVSLNVAKPIGLYAHASVDQKTGFVAIAGQISLDKSGQLVGPDDVAAQTRQVLSNISTILADLGMTWRDIAKTTTFVVGRENLPEFIRSRSIYFDNQSIQPPPNSLLLVSGLLEPRFIVEVEAIAIKSAS